MSEEQKVVRVSIYLAEETRARFKSACALHRKSMNEVLVEFIEEYLKENEPPSPASSKGQGAV